jgi:Uma2 family endonuclease
VKADSDLVSEDVIVAVHAGSTMSAPSHKPWSVEEFFAWQERQAERYELVDGFPFRMMTGAANVHDDIVVNVLAELRAQLRGSGCRPFTADGSVETRPGQIRRPDVGVDCGPRDPNGTKAALPRMVIEVLSPSTRDFDAFEKLGEYKMLASLQYILLIEPNEPMVVVWSRGGEGSWHEEKVKGLDREVDLPALGASLCLRDVYDGVSFAQH